MEYRTKITLCIVGIIFSLTILYPVEFHTFYYKLKIFPLVYCVYKLLKTIIIENKSKNKN